MGSAALNTLFAHRMVVGVGDMGVSNNPSITLSTYGLASCVAIAAYDPVLKIGGLLHLMLPEAALSPAKAAAQPAMFADTGVPMLLRALNGLRAQLGRLHVFIAGGASVLYGEDTFKIGERNIAATADQLARAGIPIRYSALRGTITRTVHFNVGTGAVTLKTPRSEDTLSLAE